MCDVDEEARVDEVRELFRTDPEAFRLALHPYLHWSEHGVRVRGRTKVLAQLAGRGSLTRPTSYELRGAQVYRWTVDSPAPGPTL